MILLLPFGSRLALRDFLYPFFSFHIFHKLVTVSNSPENEFMQTYYPHVTLSCCSQQSLGLRWDKRIIRAR